MFNLVLVEPEIPPNTGNIIRLCANTGCSLHLVHPLGFDMSEKQVRRAGLDYNDLTRVVHHDSFDDFYQATQLDTQPGVCFSTKGQHDYHQHAFTAGEYLIFGSETRGLTDAVFDRFSGNNILRIPMQETSRSMNLSNTVAVAVYEAWRQCGFRSEPVTG